MKTKLMLGVAAACLVGLSASAAAAQENPTLAAVVQRLTQLEQSNAELKAQNAELRREVAQIAAHAAQLQASEIQTLPDAGPARMASASKEHGYFEHKPGGAFTFYTPGGGEMTAYGRIDVSVDGATKGLAGKIGPDGPPDGNVGWLPDISTNLSYVGVRGFQRINEDLNLVYQFETQIDVAAQSGSVDTNSNQTDVVKGALTSRNTFIGLASSRWGAIKFGKTDAPYKQSTASMNPFSAEWGDYQVIMGNTGGDNRVEFGTRLDHSIWYESPVWRGLSTVLLYSPGQNRSDASDGLAAGEADCTGGNIPGSGGIVPVTCSDGAFSDAVSGSLTYVHGPLTLVAAYERHMRVNRSSDITGIYGSNNAYSQMLQVQDTADEDAAKIAVKYVLPTRTAISAIFEHMDRYVPADLAFQNERQRNGTWFAISQPLTAATSIHFGWAHAFRTPGDPGQHNDSLITPPGGVGGSDYTAGRNADNSADMITAAIKHRLAGNLTLYGDWAMTMNGPAAHYDLGAGGRSITTDCHDSYTPPQGPFGSNPHCWAGGQLMGTSVGLEWTF